MTFEPDVDQIEIFVDALFRYAPTQAPLGYISMRAFYDDGGNTLFRITPAQITNGNLKYALEVAEDEARRAANNPKPVVFCPPIAVFNNPKQAREEDLVLGLALSIECDAHAQEARATLEQLLGPATVVVRSGGNLYWAWGFATAYIIAMAACFTLRFRSGRWKSMRVIEAAAIEHELPTR